MPDHGQIYPPREDTFLLLTAALAAMMPTDRVLEVGTGSGYIASNLEVCSLVIATDINPHATLMAKQKGVQVVRTDLCAGLKKTFTLVLFNPPYIPTTPAERLDDWLEYALDGGPDGRGLISLFLEKIRDVILKSGRILLLVSSLQDFKECEGMFITKGYGYSIAGSQILDDGEELRIYRLIKNS